MFFNQESIMETTTSILKCMFIVSIPALFFFFYVWQSITYAHLNKKINKLAKKKEELMKKNDKLKVDIASYTSAERIESLYIKLNREIPMANSNKIITLTLPYAKKIKRDNPK